MDPSYLLSLLLGVGVLGGFVVAVPACHHRLSRHELTPSLPTTIRYHARWWEKLWQHLRRLLGVLHVLTVGRGPEGPSSHRRPGASSARLKTLGIRFGVSAIALAAAVQVDPSWWNGVSGADPLPCRVPLRCPELSWAIVRSVKDGLAAGLAWCWAVPAVAGALTAALLRALLNTGTNETVSAHACGLAMVLVALAMTLFRYLFELGWRSSLDHQLQRVPQTAGAALPPNTEYPPTSHLTHPMDRLPRWQIVLLLGAGASIGSQVLSGWLFKAGLRPHNVPADLISKFATSNDNMMPYLLANTLAFFVVVYVLLPREDQNLRIKWRTLLLQKFFDVKSLGGTFTVTPRLPKIWHWVTPVSLPPATEPVGANITQETLPVTFPTHQCTQPHWGLLDCSKEEHDPIPNLNYPVMVRGASLVRHHISSAHNLVFVLAGSHTVTSLAEQLQKFVGETKQHKHLELIVTHEENAEPPNDLMTALKDKGASLWTYAKKPGENLTEVIVADPHLVCGATHIALGMSGDVCVDYQTFAVFPHLPGGRARAYHEAIANLRLRATPRLP